MCEDPFAKNPSGSVCNTSASFENKVARLYTVQTCCLRVEQDIIDDDILPALEAISDYAQDAVLKYVQSIAPTAQHFTSIPRPPAFDVTLPNAPSDENFDNRRKKILAAKCLYDIHAVTDDLRRVADRIIIYKSQDADRNWVNGEGAKFYYDEDECREMTPQKQALVERAYIDRIKIDYRFLIYVETVFATTKLLEKDTAAFFAQANAFAEREIPGLKDMSEDQRDTWITETLKLVPHGTTSKLIEAEIRAAVYRIKLVEAVMQYAPAAEIVKHIATCHEVMESVKQAKARIEREVKEGVCKP